MPSSAPHETVLHHDLSSLLRVENFAEPAVIPQPNSLQRSVRSIDANAPDDQIARAERALAALCDEFGKWMAEECARLAAAHHAVQTIGYNDDTAMELLYAAHDIRAHAATYGYPAARDIAEGLCRLIEFGDANDHAVTVLTERHVEAISAVVRATDAMAGGTMASELTERLRFFTDQHIQSRDGNMMASPPLAPM